MEKKQTAVESKSERISKMKQLIECGKIYFDKELQDKTKELIIGVDFASAKDSEQYYKETYE